MTSDALAIVFSPNLLRAPHNDFVMIMANMPYTNKLVKALVTHVRHFLDACIQSMALTITFSSIPYLTRQTQKLKLIRRKTKKTTSTTLYPRRKRSPKQNSCPLRPPVTPILKIQLPRLMHNMPPSL